MLNEFNKEEERRNGSYEMGNSASNSIKDSAWIYKDGLKTEGQSNVYFQHEDKMFGSDGTVLSYDPLTDTYRSMQDGGVSVSSDGHSLSTDGASCIHGSTSLLSGLPKSMSFDSSFGTDMSKIKSIKTSVERKTESKQANEFQRGVVVGASATVVIIALFMILNHFGIYSIQNDPVIRLISKLLSNIF